MGCNLFIFEDSENWNWDENEKGTPSEFNGIPLFSLEMQLHYGDIDCRWTFLAFLDLKGHLVAFIKRFESGRINTWIMHKYIRAIFLLDEAITFAAIKPFYNPIRLNNTLL